MQQSIIILQLKVIPKSSLNKLEIYSYEDCKAVGKLKITALPVDGKANQAIIDFLSNFFAIPKNQVKIKSGFTSRNKIITIYDAQDDKLKQNLQLNLY